MLIELLQFVWCGMRRLRFVLCCSVYVVRCCVMVCVILMCVDAADAVLCSVFVIRVDLHRVVCSCCSCWTVLLVDVMLCCCVACAADLCLVLLLVLYCCVFVYNVCLR